MQILSDLNRDQFSAVTHVNGSMLVLAGAGSGKTKVLTTRVAWLIESNRCDLHEILAVTFTNKAASEMGERVKSLLKLNNTRELWVGTFHSIALRLLSKHHLEAGLPAYFQIIDVVDQLNLIKRIIKNLGLNEEQYPAKSIQKFININKEKGLRSGDVQVNGLRDELWQKLYSEYEVMCQSEALVDFTELLLRSYELLCAHKDILSKYQNQFKHILIDEFQDTNQLQYQWIKCLGSKVVQMFAVGDDDQSIYSFRGAMPSNMKAFMLDYAVINPIRLEQNYRSTAHILEAANAIISNNSDRIGKKLWTKNIHSEQIRWYEGYTEEDEAYFVYDEVMALQRNGANLNDMVILYRSNAQSRVFEQFFYGRGLKYRVYGGIRFFDRQEIRHVLAYLRLIVNPHDNDAFLRVVNFPTRGIGDKSVEKLQLLAKDKELSLFAACELLKGKMGNTLPKFTSLIQLMTAQVKDMELADIISHVINASGLKEHYSADKKQGLDKLENLNELINAVYNFCKDRSLQSLPEFLTYAMLEFNSNDQKDNQFINLMTVHAAKGLEFKTVFVVGLEDGLFPHENCLNTSHDLEEERRLIYVAITRAKERLYLIRACIRQRWGRRYSAPASRFVSEIPSELINNISGISGIGQSELPGYVNNPSAYYDVPNLESRTSHIELEGQGISFKIGDMVKHVKFGNGKVINLNSTGKKVTAEIFFVGLGKKTLDLNIAKLERM